MWKTWKVTNNTSDIDIIKILVTCVPTVFRQINQNLVRQKQTWIPTRGFFVPWKDWALGPPWGFETQKQQNAAKKGPKTCSSLGTGLPAIFISKEFNFHAAPSNANRAERSFLTVVPPMSLKLSNFKFILAGNSESITSRSRAEMLVHELNRSNPYSLCPNIYPVINALNNGAAGLMGARACCAPLLRSKLVCKTNELWIYLPCTIVAQPGYLGWPTLYATWRKPLARFCSLVSSSFHHPDCNSQWPVLEPFATQKKVV